jgi:hypothetical protein
LSNEDVVSFLKEDHQKSGRIVLEKLSLYPKDFSYDNNGIVTIFGITFPGSSVFQLLPAILYPVSTLEISGIYSWLSLLKRHHLMNFVQNSELKNFEENYDDKNSKWYFLGSVN